MKALKSFASFHFVCRYGKIIGCVVSTQFEYTCAQVIRSINSELPYAVSSDQIPVNYLNTKMIANLQRIQSKFDRMVTYMIKVMFHFIVSF